MYKLTILNNKNHLKTYSNVRFYKKSSKSLGLVSHNSVDQTVWLHLEVDSLVRSLIKLQQFNISQLCLDVEYLVARVKIAKSALSRLESAKKRYIDIRTANKVHGFMGLGNSFIRTNPHVYRLLNSYEDLLRADRLLKYRPSFRPVFAISQQLLDFSYMLSFCLKSSDLNAAVPAVFLPEIVEPHLSQKQKAVDDDISAIISIINEEIVGQMSSGKLPNEVYSFLDSCVLETKCLIRDEIDGRLSHTTGSDFEFAPSIYYQHPQLHQWIVYDLVQTGNRVQTLTNIYFAIERVMKDMREALSKKRLIVHVSGVQQPT